MGISLNIVIPKLQVQNRASPPAAGNTRVFPVFLQSPEIPADAGATTLESKEEGDMMHLHWLYHRGPAELRGVRKAGSMCGLE